MNSPPPSSIPSSKATRLSLPTISQGIFLLVILSLVVVNGLLIKQNRELKAALAAKQPDFLTPGQQVRSFAANTVSGRRQVVNYSAQAKTVLLVFTPQCPACERTLPYWKATKAACEHKQYQIFGISLDSSPKSADFLTTNGLNLEVFAGMDPEFKNAYKLNLTPLTIVIDNNGRVEKIWAGALDEKTKAEVNSYFGISPDEVK